MGEITIQFVGICTHLKNKDQAVPLLGDLAHRVALVHKDQDVTIDGNVIAAHFPSMTLRGAVVSGTLDPLPRRLMLRVANPADGRVTYDEHYDCAIPTLQRLSPEPLVLDREVVVNRSAPANIYFDVDAGSFSAGRVPVNAIGATLTVRTTGNPLLIATSMDGEEPPQTIELASGSVLALHNEAIGQPGHQDADFLLHYLVMEEIPPGMPFPRGLPFCPGLTMLDLVAQPAFELGPGCSNSSYP